MITHTEHPQGSLEWLQLRAGVVTASEFDQLITPLGKIREGDMPRTYLCAKLAEWWTDSPLQRFSSFDAEQGQILESEARPWFEFEYGQSVTQVSFCTTDDKRVGCSPDGLIGEDGGIEIKCPRIDTHVGYLIDGVLPKQYVAQVQGSMYVTGRKWWKFLSYHRRLPPLLLTIEQDERFQCALGEAIETFLARFEFCKARLIEINGGPPKHLKTQPTPLEVPMDVIP